MKRHQPSSPPIQLSARKQALFSVIVVGGFFLILELTLWAAGIDPVPRSKDPYVGFSSSLPLFVEADGPDGQPYLRTAPNKLHWFSPVSFRRRKAANAYRIFALGGSTTFGRPYSDELSFSGWLREYLPLADPTRHWEVINAGGISYASYRVAVLMEELLEYEPDLFIVYTGHNEFLERRTYSSLLEAPRWVTTIAGWASRTRLFAAGQLALDSAQSAGERPSALAGEVNTILEHSVGPQAYHRDDPLREQVFAHFRHNLNRMADLARSAGVEIIFVTPASNLKDCSPFKSAPSDELAGPAAQQAASLSEAASDKNGEEAAELLTEAAALDPRNAGLHYRLGLALYESGRYQEAKTEFQRAIDEDICPLRAPSAIIQIVREVAAEREALLIDFVSLVEEKAPHRIPGKEQFVDHVHPNVEGYGLIAREILAAMVRQGTLELSEAWNEENLVAARQHVLARLDQYAYGQSLLNLGQVMAWAGKMNEAERFVMQAEEILGPSSEVSAILGHAALSDGDLETAIQRLTEAVEEKPDLAFARLDLGTAYYLEGLYEEAIEELTVAMSIDPNTTADARNKLGLCRYALGDYEQALSEYRAALTAVPDHIDAQANLGVTLLALGRTAEAAGQFRKVIELDPVPKAYFNLGAALESSGDHEGAAAQFRAAFRLDPAYGEAAKSLGLNLMLTGRSEEAVAALREAIALLPEDAAAHDDLGSAFLLAGREEQALEHFERATELRPGWPPPLAHLAELMATSRNKDIRDPVRAVELAERAAELTEHSNYEVLEVAAICYAEAGRNREAARTTEQALDLAEQAGDSTAVARIRDQISKLGDRTVR